MKKKARGIKKYIKSAFFIAGILAVISIAGSVVFVASLVRGLPNADEISSRQISQSTKIYDRTGEVLLYEIHGEEKRTVVPFAEIPDAVKQATIASEDQAFYIHAGFDWRGILRALIEDITNFSYAQGGSTITQQLAKNAYLSNEKTISRKIKELLLAMKLEQQYSKDQILDLYLNQIPYGSNAYGIEAAAQTYFNKLAKDLTTAESAVLASVLRAPTYYSPYGSHADDLTKRKEFVLNEMSRLGYITDEELKTSLEEKLKFAPQTTQIKAPHFVIAVQDYLAKKYGEDLLDTGGLRVITTLNWDMQQEAEKAVETGAKRNEELYKGKNAALLAEDPKTGQVLAMVGSRDYFDTENEGNFNVATQGLRQPGSSFKPFAYVTAFEEGYTPDTVVFDVQTEFNTTGIETQSYKPENFDHVFRGPITLHNALAQSVNIPAVKVMYLAGIDNVLKTAQAFGLTTLTERSRYGLSLVLGGGEIKLSEMVNAYAVFANDGIKHDQAMILKVTDSAGNILEEYHNSPIRVIEPQYARTINNILSDVSARSPLFSSSLSLTTFGDHQVALKTGTTNNYVDAWSIGYSPGIVVGVWAGNNHREPLEKSGGSILAAVPIWSNFMNQAVKDMPLETFPKPEPYTATKPVLRGDYLAAKQIHNILYYVNKNNPQGPAPVIPENDPQFTNWESSVLEWARVNIPDFASYNQGDGFASQDNQNIAINITSPQNGSFVGDTINIVFSVSSAEDLQLIEVSFNGQVRDIVAVNGKTYLYQKSLSLGNLQTQNQLAVKITTANGGSKEQNIILFR